MRSIAALQDVVMIRRGEAIDGIVKHAYYGNAVRVGRTSLMSAAHFLGEGTMTEELASFYAGERAQPLRENLLPAELRRVSQKRDVMLLRARPGSDVSVATLSRTLPAKDEPVYVVGKHKTFGPQVVVPEVTEPDTVLNWIDGSVIHGTTLARLDRDADPDAFQTMSGGGVFNSNGKLLGIFSRSWIRDGIPCLVATRPTKHFMRFT